MHSLCMFKYSFVFMYIRIRISKHGAFQISNLNARTIYADIHSFVYSNVCNTYVDTYTNSSIYIHIYLSEHGAIRNANSNVHSSYTDICMFVCIRSYPHIEILCT